MRSTDEYRIVRTYSAGVFAGYLHRHEGKEAVIRDARRLWFWAGAASLSELAVHGTNKPSECKFAVKVPFITVTEAIEILDVTPEAQASIESVPEWRS